MGAPGDAAAHPEPVYRRAVGVVWRDLGDEALVGRPGRGIERLGGAAFAVWTALADPGTLSDLVARLGAVHDTDGTSAEHGSAEDRVREVLALLEGDGLVT